MNKLKCLLLSILFVSPMIQAQERTTKTQKGHINQNKFRQLKDVLATPNSQRYSLWCSWNKLQPTKSRLCNEYCSRR